MHTAHASNWLERLLSIKQPYLWLAIAIWLIITAGIRPLKLPDEGRYVGVAWEMLNSGQWWLPTLDGMPYFHKPPLFYWLTLLSFKSCGTGLICTRFAPLLAALASAMGLFWFLARHVNQKTGWVAVLILVTQPYFFSGAQFANHDMLVAAMITLTLLFAADTVYQKASNQAYRIRLLLVYLFAALGVLSKGLIGIALPAMVIAAWLIATHRWQFFRLFFWLPGWLVFGVVALPWLIAMQMHYPGFFDYFFIHHHLQRFTGSHFNNQQPFWFYPLALLALTLPWSLRLRHVKWSVPGAPSGKALEIAQLLGLWLTLILVFFSIPSSKPLGYLLPVLPALAGLIAIFWPLDSAKHAPLFARYLSIALVACLVSTAYENHHQQQKSTYKLLHHLQHAVHADDQLIMLGKYYFDFPFYLHLKHPAWVVERWNSPQIQQHDDWKKELAEARQFCPNKQASTLYATEHIDQAICTQLPQQTEWVIGSTTERMTSKLLRKMVPEFQNKTQSVWKITAAKRAKWCAS